MKIVSSKNMDVNNLIDLENFRLDSFTARALGGKLLKEADCGGVSYKNMQPEQRMWVAVIGQALLDLASPRANERRSAANFLSNRAGDIEMVCAFAGLHIDSAPRAVKATIEHQPLVVSMKKKITRQNSFAALEVIESAKMQAV